MSDESTIPIMPPGSMTTGSADTTLPNSREPKPASTEIRTRSMLPQAAPNPVLDRISQGPTSPEARLEKSVKLDLQVVEQAWRRYQATHDRDAVYGYLSAVYRVVMKWKREQRPRSVPDGRAEDDGNPERR